ncbi:quinone oxidoreductase family protein [Roseibium aggregatum]|uniref:Quinone oxidoreductase n=1 Tax=Roseibium aggregatum TaxID=187304 RepID=A0A926P3B2_9HYPH|nr:quinone oxidoreductase [Roseibium aggregatum]MBD1546401.1 quinone oxidoreductase [Roseibium aggregatum]
MVMAVRVHENGGPDVLTWEEVEVGKPGPGEVHIRHTAVGLNFIDTYFRSGLYPAPNGLPFIPGNEGAGVVLTVGEGVTHVKPGDRVAYVGPLGSYAEERLVPGDRLVVVPDGIDDKTAAGMMLKGMTAQYLLRRTFNVTSDTTLLFHAAAGGVGLIAGQWAAHLGATVIGTVGSAEKAELAKAHGYTHVINYREEDFVERVKEITGGKGCDVVYDSVGKDTYPGSLDCLKPFGLWASFGQSSGPITDFNMGLLAQKGSLFATRPTLFTYIASRSDLEMTANDLFDVVKSGVVKIEVNQEYRLADAAQAHKDLEGRKTTGTTVLIP